MIDPPNNIFWNPGPNLEFRIFTLTPFALLAATKHARLNPLYPSIISENTN